MSGQELIGIRECARRLGVSDTAVHKAIKTGRITIAGRTETSNRPLVAWPQARDDWGANSDATRRTHVGGTGKSQQRIKYAGDKIEKVLPTRAETLAGEEPPAPAPEAAPVGGDNLPGRAVQGPSLAQSKAVREAYMARLAKLEYEEKSGKLVNAEEVRSRAFRNARRARDALLTMPDRLAPILASTFDVQEAHRLLLEDIERTCKQIAADAEKAATGP